MKAFKLFLLLSFVLNILSFNSLSGQINSYIEKRYTDSEGLPQNSIKAIFKDKYHFIWMSTESGWVRFDGRNFKIFDSGEVKGMTSNRGWNFLGYPYRDSIFSINESGQIILVSERKLHVLDSPPKVYPGIQEIRGISDFAKYYAMLGGYSYFSNQLSIDIPQMFFADDTWFEVTNQGVSERQGADSFFTPFIVGKGGTFLAQGKALCQFATDGSYIVYSKGQSYRNAKEQNFWREARLFKNFLHQQNFVVKDKQLFRIDSITKDRTYLTSLISPFNLAPSEIYCLFYDQETHWVYVGSINKGLFVYTPKIFGRFQKPNSYGREKIEYALAAINDSTFVTATGMVIQNNRVLKDNDFSNYSDKYYLSMDRQGYLWTYNLHHVYRLKMNPDHSFKMQQKWFLGEESVASLLQNRNDTSIWLSVYHPLGDSSVLYIRSTLHPNAPLKKVLSLNFRISALLWVGEDSLFLGSKTGGLGLVSELNRHPKFHLIDPDLGIRSFYQDKKNVFVATYESGIYLIQKGNLIALPRDQDDFLRTAHCLLDDGLGNFWVPSNRGLFEIPKSSFYDFLAGKEKAFIYNYYDKNLGLTTNEFNGGCYPCALQMTKGFLYFPTMDGLAFLNRADLSSMIHYNKIYIDGLLIDQQKVEVADYLTTPKKFDRMTISVAIPYYGLNENIHVDYQFNSSDKKGNWIPLKKERQVSFTNLSPGWHLVIFRLRIKDSEYYSHSKLAFYVPPLYYQTFWFKQLIILMVLFLFLSGLYLRTHLITQRGRQQKMIYERTMDLKNTISKLRNTENTLNKQLSFQKNMMDSISHNLRTPVKYLNVLLKKDLEDQNNQVDKEQASIIYRTSHEIQRLIDNLLVYAKINIKEIESVKSVVRVKTLIDECENLLELSLLENKNTLVKKIWDDLIIRSNVEVFKVIVQNILDNAIKNTRRGEILIQTIVVDERHLMLQISDNGHGINAEKLKDYQDFFNKDHLLAQDIKSSMGLGLKIIRQLLPYIDGRINIDSREGEGTTVQLYFPKYV